MNLRFLITSCLALYAPMAMAQSSPDNAVSVNTSRLQQMESIYQKELSARHIPLLGKYLTELQRQAAAASEENQAAYQAEIARIQQVITAGGVLDLIGIQKSNSGTMPMPEPPLATVPIERKQALIALSPALAQSMSPPGEADAPTAILGEAEWRIELIAAGNYDIVLFYACPDLSLPLRVRVEFAGQTIEKTLDETRATKDDQTFRIVRLGSLTLTGDHRGETLRLFAGDKGSPRLILKNLLITRPRPQSLNP